MSIRENQIVPYVAPSDGDGDGNDDDEVPATSVGLFYTDPWGSASKEPPVEQIGRMKKWRRRSTVFTGVGIGVVLLVFLGPIGGVAGGLAGSYATKRLLKRREKKVVDRLMAMEYPLVYNEHAVFA